MGLLQEASGGRSIAMTKDGSRVARTGPVTLVSPLVTVVRSRAGRVRVRASWVE
jgi:hypothetical protein